MNDDEINRAICESIGHKHHRPTDEELKSGSYYQYEPRFTEDLNAMHEAEKTLTKQQAADYSDHLFQATEGEEAAWFFNLAHSSARLRAEVFLKTLQLTPK